MDAKYTQYESLDVKIVLINWSQIIIDYASSVRVEPELHEIYEKDYRIQYVKVYHETNDPLNSFNIHVVALSKTIVAQMLHNDHERKINIQVLTSSYFRLIISNNSLFLLSLFLPHLEAVISKEEEMKLSY